MKYCKTTWFTPIHKRFPAYFTFLSKAIQRKVCSWISYKRNSPLLHCSRSNEDKKTMTEYIHCPALLMLRLNFKPSTRTNFFKQHPRLSSSCRVTSRSPVLYKHNTLTPLTCEPRCVRELSCNGRSRRATIEANSAGKFNLAPPFLAPWAR